MVVIPIGESIVYVQPVFLQAEQTAIPELARVVVAYSDKVEMQRTLEEALLRIFGQTAQPGTDTTGTPGAPGDPDVKADAATAARLYQQAVEAQQQGDWAAYGQRLEELGRVLERLAGAETTPTP